MKEEWTYEEVKNLEDLILNKGIEAFDKSCKEHHKRWIKLQILKELE